MSYFINLPVDGHLICFYFLTIMSNDAMNFCELVLCVFLCVRVCVCRYACMFSLLLDKYLVVELLG